MKKQNVAFSLKTSRFFEVPSYYAYLAYSGYRRLSSALFWSVIGPTDRYNSLYFAYRYSYATGY